MRGERIEWEEIERFRGWADLAIRLEETKRTGFPAKVPMYAGDVLRLLAALEAGEAALVDLKEYHDMSVLEGHAPERCDGCKLFAAWRRCVAPRGAGGLT